MGCTKCNGTCSLNCTEPYHKIHDHESLEDFQRTRCTIVEGEIEITGLTSIADVEKFYATLKATFSIIEEIGALTVSKSYLLSSLHFLTNLKKITGINKHEKKYSAYILDNRNLKDLWSSDLNVEILSGKSFFYYNPMLCTYIIDRVMEKTPEREDEYDHMLNGEKAACSSQKIATNYTTTTYEAISSLKVQWENP